MEKYSESDEDVHELENEDGIFRFLVGDLWLETLQLALDSLFSPNLAFYLGYQQRGFYPKLTWGYHLILLLVLF